MSERKYTVALSFAHSDRPFAEKVAVGLRKHSITVFYDRFEQHELWGKDLFSRLREIYTQDCRYCIMFLSKSYLERMWTAFERQQIIERLAEDRGLGSVLPVRLDGFNSPVPGLSKGIGYLSVRSDKPEDVIESFLRKFRNENDEQEAEEAYKRALEFFDLKSEGILFYDRLFYTPEAIKVYFSKVTGPELHDFMGLRFHWYRKQGEHLVLLAGKYIPDFARSSKTKKEIKEQTLPRRPICKIEVPKAWVGCGSWVISYPTPHERDEEEWDVSRALIGLYLSSTDPSALPKPDEDDDRKLSVFLGAIYLDDENANMFYAYADANFESLR